MLAFTHRLHSDDLWMYLPAIKRVKRITSNNKAGPFRWAASFAYEDLGSQEVEKFTYRYLRDERRDEVDCFVIERGPVDPDSGYTRENLWVDKGEYRPRRVEYYDRKGALLKVLTLRGFRLYDNRYWRVDEMRNRTCRRARKRFCSGVITNSEVSGMTLHLIRSVSRHTSERPVAICHGRMRTDANKEVAGLRWSARRCCVRSHRRCDCWRGAGLERYHDS